MLGDLLTPLSPDLGREFADVEVPAVLRTTLVATDRAVPAVAPDASVVIVAGPEATHVQRSLHDLAARLGAPVANTWGAKGIYRWDDPHHMGTCGLQRDDFALLGLADFDLVLTVGTDPRETPLRPIDADHVVDVGLHQLDLVAADRAPRPFTAHPNQLYERMSAIARPGYADDSFPRHPARAVMDLKQSLDASERVTAQPGEVGLWVARTFPTDRMGSVVVPSVDRPGIAAAVGLASAAAGTPTTTVGPGEPDPVTAAVLDLAAARDLPLRSVRWGDDVDWSHTAALVDAAGPVVAWTR